MNKIIERIQHYYSTGHRSNALNLLYSSSLEVKLHFIRSGAFLYEIQSNSPSFKIKKALIEEGFALEEFVEDEDWRVRFQVLKIHGSQYHDSFDFEEENYNNQIQMLKDGFDITDTFIANLHPELLLYIVKNYGYDFAYEHDYIDDIEDLPHKVKIALINSGKKISTKKLMENKESILEIIPKLSSANIEKIFNDSLDNEVLKKCIEHADSIRTFYHHDKLNIFLNNPENRVWSIDRGLYIKNILEKHKSCKDTICALIKNNYLYYVYNEEQNKTVLELIYPIFDGKIANALISVNQKLLLNKNFMYNDTIIKDIYSNITSISLLDHLKQHTVCLKILSELSLRKDYLLKVQNNIDNTVIKFELKNDFIKNI